MEDSKLYSTQDIEKLKQKIANYRKTLTTLREENTFNDYLFIKDEFNDIQKQVSILEGEMNENQSVQNKVSEEYNKNEAVQSDALNRTTDELNQDLPVVLNEFSDGANSIEGTVQTKNTGSISTNYQANSPPSFKQLQGLVGKAFQNHEIPRDETPVQNNDIIENSTEETYLNKQRFLPSSTHPNQLFNGLYRNISLKTTIQYEYKNDKSTNSVKVNEFSNSPSTLAVNEVVDNEIIVDKTYESEEISPVQEERIEKTFKESEAVIEEPEIIIEEPEAVIEEPVTIIEEPEAVIEEPVTIIEEPEAVIEEPVTIIEEPEAVIEEPVTIIEEPEAVIEEPVTKQQESNKETFSMFNIFRRRN